VTAIPAGLLAACSGPAILTAEGGVVRVHPAELTTHKQVDEFYAEALATAATVVQPIPGDESLLCAAASGPDGPCFRQATHAILTGRPEAEMFDQVPSCPEHLAGAIAAVVLGPDVDAPRAVWN
jgi:hypothetical protein